MIAITIGPRTTARHHGVHPREAMIGYYNADAEPLHAPTGFTPVER